jgi:putative flippase GtrA
MTGQKFYSAFISEKFVEFFRYGLASAVALTVDFSILVLCTEVFGFYYLFSAALGFSFGIAVIYLFSIRWVFRYRRYQNKNREFFCFLLIGLSGLVMNETIMWGATELIGLHYQLSKVISVGLVFASNFTFRKLMLFVPAKKDLGASD